MSIERHFWIPTRPLTLIDTINRRYAATGSPRYAALTEDANYNGHYVGVSFNDYRGYWITEYWWAGRVVLARGSLESCIAAAKAEFNRGARGCSVRVRVRTDEEAAACVAAGLVPWNEETEKAHHAADRDSRFDKVGEAFDLDKWGIAPAIAFLANSATVEEYQAKLDEHRAANPNVKPRSLSVRMDV